MHHQKKHAPSPMEGAHRISSSYRFLAVAVVTGLTMVAGLLTVMAGLLAVMAGLLTVMAGLLHGGLAMMAGMLGTMMLRTLGESHRGAHESESEQLVHSSDICMMFMF